MKCSICGCEKFIQTTPDRPFRVCGKCEAMERHRALWNIMSSNIAKGAKILDISPISNYLFKGKLKEIRPDIKYVGVDKYRSGNPLDQRDSSFCDMYFDLVDMLNYVESEVFDIVIMQHVLEEIENYKKCLENISKVLKKQGIAYLEIPNCDFLLEHIKQEPDRYGNVWQFSKSALFYELKDLYDSVEIIEYNEGGFVGNIFVCKK